MKNPGFEIRIPEKDAYDWLNGLGDCAPKYYPDAMCAEAGACGKYMDIKHQYTDSNTNSRVFFVEWYVMPVRTKEQAINFAKKIPIMAQHYDTYWSIRKKHYRDDDGELVIGFRRV